MLSTGLGTSLPLTAQETSPAPSAQPVTGTTQSAPQLSFAQSRTDASLAVAYRAALKNLLETNTVPYGTGSTDAYNQAGLLSESPSTLIRAGGGYKQPWTRDASVNSWNAASLLEPAVARNTLWSVVRREPDGQLIVQQDNQWWDQTIWIAAAWNHYLVTGDRAFLADAYQTAINTLRREKEHHFNAAHGLFQGPAFLNDGIAGYPAPPADANESRGSFVLDYPGADKIMVLSTNCIYVGAYRSAAQMALELGRSRAEAQTWNSAADSLAAQIRRQFWIPAKGRFGYLIHADTGALDDSQEGAGLAFSMLFGIATPTEATDALHSAHLEPSGMVDVWPDFARYNAARPGRHNVIVWPPIQSFWAEAAARYGDEADFQREVESLASLSKDSGGEFYEVYNAATGAPDGGWQVGHNWTSEHDQTWSATGYLRMIYTGLFGLRFKPAGLHFEPLLPAGWGNVSLTGLHYRNATLTIQLRGAGDVIQAYRLDGVLQKQHLVPASLRGPHTVRIDLAPRQ